jgi:hypothetical protein
MDTKKQNQEHIDSAALAGATLAGVLAVLVPEGPFDWTGPVVGITLLALIYAYIWRGRRTRAQSVAVAAVVAFCSLLIFGVFLELICGHGHLSGHLREDTHKVESNVESWWLATIWLIVTVICALVDRSHQKRL